MIKYYTDRSGFSNVKIGTMGGTRKLFIEAYSGAAFYILRDKGAQSLPGFESVQPVGDVSFPSLDGGGRPAFQIFKYQKGWKAPQELFGHTIK